MRMQNNWHSHRLLVDETFGTTTLENWHYLLKINIGIPYNLVIPFWCIYPTEMHCGIFTQWNTVPQWELQSTTTCNHMNKSHKQFWTKKAKQWKVLMQLISIMDAFGEFLQPDLIQIWWMVTNWTFSILSFVYQMLSFQHQMGQIKAIGKTIRKQSF